jgi:hypothetical protein
MVSTQKPFYPDYMENGRIYTLIPLTDFKAILGIDDREDALSQYCLTTATFTIEQYCMRRLFVKKHHERIEFSGDYIFPLWLYPVREILGVFLMKNEELIKGGGILVQPDLYHTVPDCGIDTDIPFCLSVSPTLRLVRGVSVVQVQYWAGYSLGKIPADLASACLELAAWNMARYRGKRIGMTGNIRGSGKHFEASMPENVRQLLEPYRRRTI